MAGAYGTARSRRWGVDYNGLYTGRCKVKGHAVMRSA
jgi:hypothetical protein